MLNIKQRENGIGLRTFPLWHTGGMFLQYGSLHSGSAVAYDAGVLRATKSLRLNTLWRSYAICAWCWKGYISGHIELHWPRERVWMNRLMTCYVWE